MGIEEKELTNVLLRLRRIEGQVRGLQRMIEEDRPLDDILNQLAASKRAFDEAGLQIIALRMRESLGKDIKGCERSIAEALDIFIKYANYVR
jgi:DNA-binding FrmR family transcriptional regulator